VILYIEFTRIGYYKNIILLEGFMKIKNSYLLILGMLLPIFSIILCSSSTKAATEAEIEASILAGTAWVAGQQNGDGSWGSLFESVAFTGFAVLKLEDRTYELYGDPLDDEGPFFDNIEAGLEYICDNVQADGSIVYFGNAHHANYNTALAIMALTSSRDPDYPCGGDDAETVVEDAVDYLLAAQYNSGPGGWGYNILDNGDPGTWNDNSNSGYVALGLIYANSLFGIDISSALTGLETWITYIQNPVDSDTNDGGSGYTGPESWVNMLKTGNLLFQMSMVGDDAATPRVIDAVDYLERHWNDTNPDPGFRPGFGVGYHYQSMFAMMKGFQSLGIAEIDVGGPVDWYEEFSDIIVNTQEGPGNWPIDYWGNQLLATTWALLTLERVVEVPKITVVVDIKPSSCPNPFNPKSKGVIPVAILGTEDFDVTTIDPATVRITFDDLEGVAPLRWDYEDVGTPYEGELCGCHDLNGDGYMDMTLKFDTQEMEAALQLSNFASTYIPLTISGNLLEEFGARYFDGSDCMKILGKSPIINGGICKEKIK
jgi:hypothetical protein